MHRAKQIIKKTAAHSGACIDFVCVRAHGLGSVQEVTLISTKYRQRGSAVRSSKANRSIYSNAQMTSMLK